MAKKQAAPATDAAKVRAHAARLGFDPAAVDRIAALLRARPDLGPILLAQKPPKVAAALPAASPEALDAEREAIERSFAGALGHAAPDAEPDGGPPRMAGPATEALVAMAFRSLLDLAGRSVDAASRALVAVVDKYIPTP